MDKPKFFSLDLKQPVNSWLCIALLSVMCFWVVVFYLANRTFAVGENLAHASSSLSN